MLSVTETPEDTGPIAHNVRVATSEAQASSFLGTQNRVLLTAAQTGGAAGVIDISIAPGAGAPLHTNTREALIWYVIEGTLTFQTEEGRIEVEKHGSMFLPHGSTHMFVNTAGTPTRALLVCIPGGFEEYLALLGKALPDDTPAGPPPLEAIKSMVVLATQFGVEIRQDAPA